MKTRHTSWILLVSCCAVAPTLAETIPWKHQLAPALASARKQHRLVFAYFGAAWCPGCLQTKKTIFPHPKFAKAIQRFVPLEIDVDEEPQTAQEYGISSLPHIMFLTPEGHVAYDVDEVYLDIDRFIQEMDKALAAEKKFRDLETRRSRHPGQIELDYRYASALIRRRQLEQASPLIDQVVKADKNNAKGYASKLLLARAQALGQSGEEDKVRAAMKDLQRVISAYPKSSEFDAARYYLAAGHFLLGEMKQAEALLREVVKSARQESWKQQAAALLKDIRP